MSAVQFEVGQRWVSNSEAELGLGIIREISGRRLEILFPAAGETRTYAIDNAPIGRVHYPVDDKVSTQDGILFTITEKHELNGCFVYQGVDDEGNEVSIHEMDLDSKVHFSQPQDRLFAGQIDKNSQFDLRIKALAHQHRLQQSSVFGLLGARVQLLPHQLYIAHEVANRFAPRVLLADEVGLGKTIEAGLILHQQLLTGRVSRVLIVVPESLLHQWLVEMLRRFNLQFTIMDDERYLAASEQNENNPFDEAQLWLCSLQTLTENNEISTKALAADWDLLIVDEAHHLEWHEDKPSEQYRLIAQLAAAAPGLLLLTATPEQLGIESHFARLRLLDPDRYFDLAKFKQEEANYQPVSELVQQLLSADAQSVIKTDDALQQRVEHYLGNSVLQALQTEESFEQARHQAIKDLLDHHGTGRILFRNTRDVVSGFPARKLHSYPLPMPELCAEVTDKTAVLQAEKVLAEDWLALDPRVAWLADWLKLHRGEKVLLICSQAETAQQLETFLRIKHGCRSAVFHEGLTLINRDRAAAYFADEEEGAQLLVCSEIGSEGRNFQFAHHLVLFDLPLNPDLLEQRIGRLDRIGQYHTVDIHVPYYQNSAHQVLLDWYHLGLNAFERVFAAGGSVYQQMASQLHKCLAEPDNQTALDSLIHQTQTVVTETLEKLQQGRDRLIELNSFNQHVADEVIAELEQMGTTLELADFMDDVFDEFGVEQQTHSADSIIIEPGNHMTHHHFPGLPEDGITATYQRHRALVREDMAFLSWEHPMVSGSLDLIINSDFGNNAFCTLETAAFPAGTLLLEAVFRLQCSAPKQLQIGKYLQHCYLRYIVDERGRSYHDKFDESWFRQHAGRIPRLTAQELVRHARDNINTLVDKAKQSALAQQQTLINNAVTAMLHVTGNEHMRLKAMARINPNIRQQEIDYIEQSQVLIEQHLQSSSLILDAVRIAIVTEPS